MFSLDHGKPIIAHADVWSMIEYHKSEPTEDVNIETIITLGHAKNE